MHKVQALLLAIRQEKVLFPMVLTGDKTTLWEFLNQLVQRERRQLLQEVNLIKYTSLLQKMTVISVWAITSTVQFQAIKMEVGEEPQDTA